MYQTPGSLGTMQNLGTMFIQTLRIGYCVWSMMNFKWKKSSSSMVKWPLLVETLIVGIGLKGITFLTLPWNLDEVLLSIGLQGPHLLRTSGKAVSQGSTSSTSLRSGKETAFKWFIWHKALAITEWRVCIAHASISKRRIFCLPNTSKSIRHELWDCIQARRAQRWATFIMHELCGVRRTGNCDSFHWKQALFGERIPKKFGKKIKFWHLLCGITLWTIRIECNDKVFNHEQWHEPKVKHRIWAELIIYTKVAWEQL